MPGFHIAIKGAEARNFLCVVCSLLLKEPFQTICGHRCCRSCAEEKSSSPNGFICPVDSTLVTKVFPDRFVEREILSLPCCCEFAEYGCDWTGVVKDYEEHVVQCKYRTVPCRHDGCKEVISKVFLDRHLATECLYRHVECPDCKKCIPSSQMKKHHLTTCPRVTIKCSQCEKDVFRGLLETHQEQDCNGTPTPCQFSKIGCAANKPMKKNDKTMHMESELVNHVLYLLNFGLDLSQRVSKLAENKRGDTEADACQAEVDLLVDTVAQLHKHCPASLRTEKGFSQSRSATDAAIQARRHASLPVKMTTIASAQGMPIKSTDEMTALKVHDGDALDQVNRRIAALRDNFRQQDAKLEHLLQNKARNIADQGDRMEELENANYSGTLIWKITDFTSKRHQSIVGKSVSLYSPYFYTGQYGYKMRLRVYLNGDGMGKGSHISLFFVICKGKYDALLSWPFRQNVRLTILDQEGFKNVSESFKADPSSSSFKRPTSAMNIASGCPLFMPHSILDTQAYVNDDSLFIKAEVDAVV